MTTFGYPAEVDTGLLWMGELEHALSRSVLNEIGITHILTVGEMAQLEDDPDRERLMFYIHDHEDEFLGGVFERAFEFIRHVCRTGGRVLVHCREGRSRSPGLVMAWLMTDREMPVMEAFDHVRRVRRQVMPNAGFWEDLVDLEVQLRCCNREELLNSLPSYVHASARRKGPPATYSRFLTAALNNAPKEVIDAVIQRWDPSEWQLSRDPITEVMLACFDKLQPEARKLCAGFFAALMAAGSVNRQDVVDAFRALSEDTQRLADIELDVPHLRKYLADLKESLVKYGLLLSIDRTTSSPPVAVKPDEADDGGSTPLARTMTSGPRLVDDSEREWFYFPDGMSFSLPARWGVREYILKNRLKFRLDAYRSLEPGDKWESPEGTQTFEMSSSQEKAYIPLRTIEKPSRHIPLKQHRAREKEHLIQSHKRLSQYNNAPAPPSSEGWFVEKDRLLSVLSAMVAGDPLPPIAVDYSCGPTRVVNGFHRYFVALILGYKEVPVVREKPMKQFSDGSSTNGKKKHKGKQQQQQQNDSHLDTPAPRPKWEPKAKVQERLEKERLERERLEKQQEKAALAREVLEGAYDKSLREQMLLAKQRKADERKITERRTPVPPSGGLPRSTATYAEKAAKKRL